MSGRIGRSWLAAILSLSCHFDDTPDAPDAEADPEGEPTAIADRRPGETAVAADPGAEPGSFADRIAELARAAEARSDAAAADPALSDEQRTELARTHFAAGTKAFAASDYAEAAHHFEAAYALTPELHALAYNLAVTYDRAGDCCTARLYFALFLVNEQDPSLRDEVTHRLEAEPCECSGTP